MVTSRIFFFALLSCLQSCQGIPKEDLALATRLENTSKADLLIFKLRDDKGHGMDCLDVFQARSTKNGACFGVSHTLRNGVFSVHLSESIDLKNWRHLVELDQHGSQATVHQADDGTFLLAYEKDAPNSCWIRLRSYPDLKALRSGKHDREIDLPRTRAPTAEGTPSLETVEIMKGHLSTSKIRLRFHYYKRAQVDQLASGTLTNFERWEASPSRALNQAFIKRGANGNIGDRSKFIWKDRSFYLQEVQGSRGNWGTWGLFLCDSDGFPLKKLDLKTPGKSIAFANAAVSKIRDQSGKELLILTAFLHSKGSSPQESGQMLVAFKTGEGAG